MTRRTPRRTATAAALAIPLALVLGAAPDADSASTTVGEAFAPSALCYAESTLLQADSPGDRWAAPAAGVITSFRFVPGPGPAEVAASVAFKLARPTTATAATIVATTAQVSVTREVTTTAAVRIPARAGDVIGLSLGPGPDGRCVRVVNSSPDQEIYVLQGDATVGTTLNSSNYRGVELDVEATLEPDADGDGFGDVTQDTCPTQATTQGTCAPPPPPPPPVVRDTAAPETAIASLTAAKAKRKPNGKLKKAALTATFSASEPGRTTCSLDGAASTPCTSPYVAKVKVGTHRLVVTATDTAGNVDPTPASATVGVKAAKKKRR